MDNGAKSEDHVKPVEVDDITAAVKLSIAASEALLIHEIIDSGQTTNSLSASAILEVALHVKQARLEGYIEASNIMHEETSDVDYLSDLDDSMMKGAYEDVGLNLCDFHLPSSDLNISQVNDTYSLENCNGDEKMDYEDAHRLGVNSADLVTKLQPNDSTCFGIPPKRNDAIKQPEDSTCFGLPLKGNDALVPFDNVKQKKFSKDLSQGPRTLDIASDMNVLETPEIISTTNVVEETPGIISTTKVVEINILLLDFFPYSMLDLLIYYKLLLSSLVCHFYKDVRFLLFIHVRMKFQSCELTYYFTLVTRTRLECPKLILVQVLGLTNIL